MPPTKQQPIVYDGPGWQVALLDHQRRLFERVVSAFPTELKGKRGAVDLWRLRLSGSPSGAKY
jgi:hypothetical protein